MATAAVVGTEGLGSLASWMRLMRCQISKETITRAENAISNFVVALSFSLGGFAAANVFESGTTPVLPSSSTTFLIMIHSFGKYRPLRKCRNSVLSIWDDRKT